VGPTGDRIELPLRDVSLGLLNGECFFLLCSIQRGGGVDQYMLM
jgi:hypothetical protein